MTLNGKSRWKDALMAVFVGALVAFLTSLLEGALDFLKNGGAEAISGSVSSAVFAIRRILV